MDSFFHKGMTYEYNAKSQFIIQTGRYEGSYRVKKIVSGIVLAPSVAIKAFRDIKVSDGYKKRLLLIHDGEKSVLDKLLTEATKEVGKRK